MQMKMEKKTKKFDRNKVKKLLEEENEYIIDLLTTFDVPDSVEDEELDAMYLLDSRNEQRSKPSAHRTSRAQDAQELQDRMEIIRNKIKCKKSKASERTLKKRELKKVKREKILKRKLISAHKTLKNELVKEEKLCPEERKETIKQIKPIFNEDGKMVFSKFDFASHPGAKVKRTKRDKVIKNPQEILKSMKEQKKKISELVQQGEEHKAKEMQKEFAWKKAFDKTEGKKVKDDPTLLHKAVKKKKDEKKKSRKKWAEREEKLEHDIAQRQRKRQENINKKLKDKKVRKLKRLSKRGRIIPGF